MRKGVLSFPGYTDSNNVVHNDYTVECGYQASIAAAINILLAAGSPVLARGKSGTLMFHLQPEPVAQYTDIPPTSWSYGKITVNYTFTDGLGQSETAGKSVNVPGGAP